MPRPKKKVILIIVEGKSDKSALERPIQGLLEGNEHRIEACFLVAKTDVTSDSRNNPSNILNKINQWYFEPFFSANEHYYPKDIIEVVQICDLDGTFIPDENCHAYTPEHSTAEGFVYAPPCIYGPTSEIIIDRNHRKADNIRFLLAQTTIKVKSKTVPYSVYFFSSNIDHYLHDHLNLDARAKNNQAESFADKCTEDPDYFVKRICRHSQALKNMSYQESWDFIMSDCNSIKRHTNFNIYIEALIKKIREAP